MTGRQARSVTHLLDALTELVDVELASGRVCRVHHVISWGQDMGEEIPYLMTSRVADWQGQGEDDFFYADEVVAIRAVRADGVVFDVRRLPPEVS
jgi:hypothetical protein